MRRERNRRDERRRHRVAMRRDMAHLSRGEPKPGQQRRQHGGDEQHGQIRRTHDDEV